MNKKILLIEPRYKTKYPPLGLMKLSSYHKMKGDEVTFIKGCDKNAFYQYWDRIYITTLFTYTWKETIKTIKFYRENLFNISGKCFVGGILASLMPKELFNETGIQPIVGLLDDPKKIDQEDGIIVDNLIPDYDILKQVENNEFKYVNTDAYIGYTTRGCIWKCKFCAVRNFEPKFIPYIDIKGIIREVEEKHGEKQNLLLMDNNVLASPKFDKIIDDIKECGFVEGAKFGKTNRKRVVDFNQGLDARLLTEKKMKRLAEIPLEPMRLGFDDIKLKKKYIKAVRLAHRFGQKNMSNYVLYNFNDTPEDFYERLKINIELNEEFAKENGGVKTCIYSFPMRFIPLNAKTRDVNTGNKHWNKRFLRGVKLILNVTKGPVMPGSDFFYQAFGRNSEEFKTIILMPEDFIRYRVVSSWRNIADWEKRLQPYVKDWIKSFSKLTKSEKLEITETLGENGKVTKKQLGKESNKKIKKLLEFHLDAEEIVESYRNDDN